MVAELEQLVLLALLRLGPEAYGVAIAEEIEARAGRTASLGSVYKTLIRLKRPSGRARAAGCVPPPRDIGGMRLRSEQVQALGGTTECQTGPPGPSVKRVGEGKAAFTGFTLGDTQGKPVPGTENDVTLPDGSHVKDHLDAAGKVRIEDIDTGACTVTFPAIDRRDFV